VPRHINDSEFEFLVEEAVLPVVGKVEADALVLCCGADCLAGDPLSKMELSNVALWDAVDRLTGKGLPTVILGGGGYNPWTVTRYWAGMWGRISGQPFPEQLPAEASEYLRAMECDLIDEDEVDEAWLTTLADTPYPGPVRDEIKSLVRHMKDTES
jgi:acetoin utilization protein AcuC